MTIQAVVSEFENKYPRRGDRLREEPSAKNAQGLFPPDACIFVGNLSTKVGADDLAEDLKKVFTEFGPCHVKIKQDKKKGLPGAFVQFEKVEDATAALAKDERVVLHDRWLRIERAKGRRTACLGLRSGAPITSHDVSVALEGRGPLEVFCIESYPTGPQAWTLISKVTFAYVDDCRDAIKYFQKDDKYYLSLLDMEGSPMLPASRPHLPFRSNGHNSVQLGRNLNGYRNNHNGRPPRNGTSRGHHRGSEMRPPRQNLQQQEGFLPHHLRGNFPDRPIWMSNMGYNQEPTQPHYPPTFLPFPNEAYGNPTLIFDGQPRYDYAPLPPLPGGYGPGGCLPGGPGGPFIINSQPPYDNHGSAAYHDFYAAHNGPFNPPPINVSQQSGYIMPQPYNEPRSPESGHLISHSKQNEAGASLAAAEKPEEDSKESIIETLLEANRQEKAPKLIRVYASHEEENGATGASSSSSSSPPQCGSSNSSLLLWLGDTVKETEGRIKKEAAAQDRGKGKLTKHTHDSSPALDSDKSTDGRSQKHRFNINHDGASIKELDGISIPSRSRSRSCSPPSCPIGYLVSSDAPSVNQQKISLKDGQTIEELVRRMAEERDDNLSETLLRDVIKSLEIEQKEKDTQMAKRKMNVMVDSGSSRSRSRSLTRTSSSKSI